MTPAERVNKIAAEMRTLLAYDFGGEVQSYVESALVIVAVKQAMERHAPRSEERSDFAACLWSCRRRDDL